MTTMFMVGCDPELFLKKDGNYVASCDLVGGTKDVPMPLEGLPDGFTVQEDNVAVEFGIPPANSKLSFLGSISTVMNELTRLMQEKGLSLDKAASTKFPESELWHPKALMFGCDPDFNIWTGKRNPRPKADDTTLRSCGGHVHVGIDPSYDWKALIKNMDFHLGVPSVLMDKDEDRRKLYGMPGAYRRKPYGVEYRTLSNFWVFDPKLTGWVWDGVEKAVNAVDAQFQIDELQEPIQRAISTNDKKLARELVEHFNLSIVEEAVHV